MLACGNSGFYSGSIGIVPMFLVLFFSTPQLTLFHNSSAQVHLGALLKHRTRTREVQELRSHPAQCGKAGGTSFVQYRAGGVAHGLGLLLHSCEHLGPDF